MWAVRLLGARVGWGSVRGLVRSEVRGWKGGMGLEVGGFEVLGVIGVCVCGGWAGFWC